ncbi:MAG: hypothetical protein OZSIB_1721 [Candidatus Ozemobacter sibiricus]|uniref:Uncharacterized protein n=1 Tax=Candidatus Ozemobacter sibiricus TaxID=2268124 RepID=A0A367ZJB0_9BACT|nr:MAG: hypothetical protein OZSIB_1721 [Candidatus Ozemobacter sibiricus]
MEPVPFKDLTCLLPNPKRWLGAGYPRPACRTCDGRSRLDVPKNVSPRRFSRPWCL